MYNLPAISCSSVPVGPVLDPVTQALYKIKKHAAARSFDYNDQKSADHLPHSAQKTVNGTKKNADTIPSSQEYRNCKKITLFPWVPKKNKFYSDFFQDMTIHEMMARNIFCFLEKSLQCWKMLAKLLPQVRKQINYFDHFLLNNLMNSCPVDWNNGEPMKVKNEWK